MLAGGRRRDGLRLCTALAFKRRLRPAALACSQEGDVVMVSNLQPSRRRMAEVGPAHGGGNGGGLRTRVPELTPATRPHPRAVWTRLGRAAVVPLSMAEPGSAAGMSAAGASRAAAAAGAAAAPGAGADAGCAAGIDCTAKVGCTASAGPIAVLGGSACAAAAAAGGAAAAAGGADRAFVEGISPLSSPGTLAGSGVAACLRAVFVPRPLLPLNALGLFYDASRGGSASEVCMCVYVWREDWSMQIKTTNL